MKTRTFVLIVLLVLTVFGIVVMAALMADVDTAGAADECWPGCPHPPLRPQIWLPYVGQEQPKWFDRDNAEGVTK